MPQEMRMDALRLQAGLCRQPPQDHEGSGTSQRPTLRVEEELRPVAPVEVGAAAREIAPKRVHGGPSDRNDPLLLALADAPDEAAVEVDRRPRHTDGLADA